MLTTLILLFFLAGVAPFLAKMRRTGPVIMAACTAAALGYFLSFAKPVIQGESLVYSYDWAASLGVSLSFLLDGLSLLFVMLILFFGVLVTLYAIDYLGKEKHKGRFYAYLLFFMASMLGLVLSANLISIFVFWELTSFSSYLLIGFYHTKKKPRKAARQALLVTGIGGLALLAGFILMGIVGGSYEVTALLADSEALQEHPYLEGIIILVLLGAFSKSAQFPFHFWLPDAMAAPTPVSAYLHSSTMVKAGVYLIFRLHPAFADTTLWLMLLSVFGAVTMIMGAVKAFKADDLKRILAYTTISALGIFVMMAGRGTGEAIKGALIYLLAHALYKGALFFAAGILAHKFGSRKLSELSRIKKKMPCTTMAVLFAGISMAGLIPFLGFTGKELLYEAVLHSSFFNYSLLVLLIVSNVIFVAIAIKIVYRIFFATDVRPAQGMTVKEAPVFMLAPPLVLGILGLFLGLIPGVVVQPVAAPAVKSILDNASPPDLHLWHGFDLVVLLSGVTLLLGVLLYFIRNSTTKIAGRMKWPLEKLPAIVFIKALSGLKQLAYFQTRFIQGGYLRNYVAISISTFVLILSAYLIFHGIPGASGFKARVQDFMNPELVVLVLVIVVLRFVFQMRSRIMVVAAIGIIGYGIALSYALFSAPDVAITQFLAETLSLILLILIMQKLPGHFNKAHKRRKRYVFISLAFGLLMTLVTLIGMNITPSSSLKDYFLENSIPEGKGANAVNVILVDFRALDTLGEISVLVIAMVGIVCLYNNYKTRGI